LPGRRAVGEAVRQWRPPIKTSSCIIDRPLLHPALLSASDTVAVNNIERSTRQYITYFPTAWPAQTNAGAGALRNIFGWMARVRTPSDIPFNPAPDATGELKHPSRALLTRQHSPLSRLPLIPRLELPSPVQRSAAAHLRRLQSYRKERSAERRLLNDQPRTGHAKRPTNPTLFRDFNWGPATPPTDFCLFTLVCPPPNSRSR